MSLRTPLSEAKGLGSAKEGAGHWWLQRITAVALVPLCFWFAISVALLGSENYTSVVTWLQQPLVVVLMILFLVAMFYHTQLGLQVIIEDYVGGWLKIFTLVVVNFLCIIFAVAGIIAALKIFL